MQIFGWIWDGRRSYECGGTEKESRMYQDGERLVAAEQLVHELRERKTSMSESDVAAKDCEMPYKSDWDG